ncbi:MAG: tRNA pseudouridine(38-40) synthase TruA [Verrucomicrobia bacterium]|nr:tRNA pseudouridine(38-40) synthase TruA [Verrucomicrobiota bacterium]
MKNRYIANISYDGTNYYGWQVQSKHRTVQGEIQRVLTEITGQTAIVHGSGRTDAKVHAKGQVAHFDLAGNMRLDKLQTGLNALLDPDIRVNSIKQARSDFHARKSAVRKEYRYFIWNDRILMPFLRDYRTHILDRLDEVTMAKAARRLIGRHDFAAFSANPNREIEGTVRELYRLDVRRYGREIRIIAQGNGFLYKMVRSLAGFLIQVGIGKLGPADGPMILDTKTRTAVVPTAHPQGLFLWKVFY